MLSAAPGVRRVFLIGKENVGKSSLVRALTGRSASFGNDPSMTTRLATWTTKLAPLGYVCDRFISPRAG